MGTLKDTQQLAAVGLGNMVCMLLPYSVMVGVNTALETFVAQAFGRDSLAECGTYLHRAIFVIAVLYIPITAVLINTGWLLEGLGIEASVAAYANTYVNSQLIAVFMHAMADSVVLFLTAMGQTYVVAILQVAVIPFHVGACWLFITHWGYGIQGAAYAENFTSCLTVLLQVVYASNLSEISEAWFLPTRQTFKNLPEFLSLAVPGIVMLFLENMNMEILVLMSGMLQNTDMMAAQVIVVTIAELSMMIPYGLSLGAVCLVGQSLGGNRPLEAQANFKLIAQTGTIAGLVFCWMAMLLRTPIVAIYSSSDLV